MEIDLDAIGDGIKRVVKDINNTISQNGGKKKQPVL